VRHPSVAAVARVAPAIAPTATVVGVSVLAGWILRLPGIHQIHPVFGTMGPHTALGFTLAGASLWLLNPAGRFGPRARAGQTCAAMVLLLSLVTLAATQFAWTLPLDPGILPDAVAALVPLVMPTPSALAFLSIGLALLLLNADDRRIRASEPFAFAAALIALLALIAFGYDFLLTAAPGPRRALAFHSVFLFQALAVGVLMSRPNRGLMRLATGRTVTGVMVRRLLPAAVGLPIVLGALVVVGQRAAFYPSSLSLSYYTVSIVVVFSALIVHTALLVDRADTQRREAKDRLRALNTELERRVAERTAELETVNKELEAFSYSVSHDLRAPLRHITGFAEMLMNRAGPALDDQGRGYVRTIANAAGRLARLIDDLLAFSRMSRAALHRRRVDLNTLVLEARNELLAHATTNGRAIDWHIAPLPEVEGDPAMLHQVVVNLLSNALKYTSPRAVARIQVGTVSDKTNDIVLFVQDNGVGFDMKYLDKLFGVFQRLHRADEFEGTGIGLANIKRIITRHGGRVWAEGQVDRGATFYVALPALSRVKESHGPDAPPHPAG
jgi:signal transduction histidine kinase